MKIIDNNGKTIFEGGFDSTNLIFDAKDTDLSEPDKRIRYIDPDIIKSEVGNALYKIATSVWNYYNGVDEEETEFYINVQTDQLSTPGRKRWKRRTRFDPNAGEILPEIHWPEFFTLGVLPPECQQAGQSVRRF